MKSKAGSLRKKILLAKLSKREKDSVQIKKSINENEDIRAGTEEIKKNIKSYFKSLYYTK